MNEIRSRAVAFAKEWEGERRESAGKQTFWNEFLEVFGISRRRVAAFEQKAATLGGHRGWIDLFWPGMLLVEHKSAGQDLTAAFDQARGYFAGLAEKDLPRCVVVSDFARFRVYDLDKGGGPAEFDLGQLHLNLGPLLFLAGYTFRSFEDAPEVNVRAAKLMARLHESLRANGYTGHPLAVLLVRLMFCFFADKTGIFPPNLFRDYMERMIEANHRNVGGFLTELFEVLNTPVEKRQQNIDRDLAEFEYVNGHLFEECVPIPAFGPESKQTLQDCMAFDWSVVSPAIFGAMFQGVMDEEKGRRREIGAHYTSEKNILKAINPLLIDGLRAEFGGARSERALRALLKKIAGIKVLDPACGCGNFLIIAYRELRQLEIEIHERLQQVLKRSDQKYLNVTFAQGLDVDSMYGIEIEEFPCRVAETALYLVDHQMNNRASEKFGESFRRLPLSKAPHIVQGNALRIDWDEVVAGAEVTCVVGNPPFIGKAFRSEEQAEDVRLVFGEWPKSSELDYVAAWHAKAVGFARRSEASVAFVSTNSITQGEQTSILWPSLVKAGVRINFAHRTFQWSNEASGQAAVHCVIVGWTLGRNGQCALFDYDDVRGEPLARRVDRINPYLVDAEDVFVFARRTPLCDVPPIIFGSMPNDAGNLLLDREERAMLLREEPGAKRFLRRIYGSKEFINGLDRWCLWLVDAAPSELRAMPAVQRRIEAVKAHREASDRPTTQRLAETSWLFGEIRQPETPYLAIPKTSSQSRRWIPMAFLPALTVTTTEILMVPGADLFHFGMLQSSMHMAWVRAVAGRLKSDIRYSNEIVYNNFAWPEGPPEKLREAVRLAAQAVLDARKSIKGQSLADLYDVDLMPSILRKAHGLLDRAVDACYGLRKVESELDRVKFLFDRYAELIASGQMSLPIAEPEEPKGKRRSKGK